MMERKIVLRVALPTFFISLTALVGGSIIVYNYLFSAGALKAGAREYMREVGARVIEKTVAHLCPAPRLARLNSWLLEPGESGAYLDRFNRITLPQMRTFPQIALLYFGDASGNLWLVGRQADGTLSTQWIQRLADSPQSRTDLQAARELSRKRPEQNQRFQDLIAPYLRTHWWHRNQEGQVKAHEITDKFLFDPRWRPWYQKAKAKKALSWTGPYIYTATGKVEASGKPGITVSAPVLDGDRLIGVVGVDIVLKEISEFLSTLAVGEHGQAFILTRKGRTVALADYQQVTLSDGQTPRFNHVSHIQNPAVSRSFAIFGSLATEGETAPDSLFDFEHQGSRYLGLYLPFPNEQLDWVVGIVAPEDDFIGGLKEKLYLSLAGSLLGLLLALLISFYFSKRITGPLDELTLAARRIQKFRVDQPVAVNSMFKEIHQMAQAFRHMQSGLRSFAKYVPADLVRYLIRAGKEAALGGEERTATVFFSDVADFTAISETLPPQQLVEHMSRYLGRMSDIIAEHQGTVDKYIGDAIMAFWNAPGPVPDHARQACLAALKCQEQLKQLRDRWETRGLPRLHARIGISTGELIVGNMGTQNRLNYTVLGDTVNLASRLEGLAKLYGVALVIGEKTLARAGEGLAARCLDRVVVKGKTQSVLIYELVGKKEAISADQAAFIQAYEKALALYFDRQWDGAILAFGQALGKVPEDRASKVMIGRCQRFKSAPPPQNWDGAYRVQRK